jgi:hypothetical protein
VAIVAIVLAELGVEYFENTVVADFVAGTVADENSVVDTFVAVSLADNHYSTVVVVVVVGRPAFAAFVQMGVAELGTVIDSAAMRKVDRRSH